MSFLRIGRRPARPVAFAAACLVLSACTAQQACDLDAAAQPLAADVASTIADPKVQAGVVIDEALVHPLVQAGCKAVAP